MGVLGGGASGQQSRRRRQPAASLKLRPRLICSIALAPPVEGEIIRTLFSRFRRCSRTLALPHVRASTQRRPTAHSTRSNTSQAHTHVCGDVFICSALTYVYLQVPEHTSALSWDTFIDRALLCRQIVSVRPPSGVVKLTKSRYATWRGQDF